MPVGLQVFNDNSILQIDADYRMWSLVEKRSVATDAVIAVTGSYPIIAYRSTVYTRVIFSKSGSTFYFKIETPMGVSAQTIPVYIFDISDAQKAANFGMQVFNEAGKVVFESARNQMRIIDVVESINPETLTKSYDRPILVVKNANRYNAEEYSGVGDAYNLKYDSFRCTTAQNFQIDYPTYDLIPNTAVKKRGDRNYLIIDATGLP